MKKTITVLVLCCLMVLTLLLVACGGQETTTTTTKSTTTTTSSNTTTTTTTTSTTTTHTTTQTTTTTTTTTTTQTVAENPFHGSVNGTWTGQAVTGQKIDGTFSVIIDKEGNITGIFSGDYNGNITGYVDEYGNLNAVGKGMVGDQYFEFIWLGTATLSGTTINAQGTWAGLGLSGTFTGTGQTA